MKLCFIASVFDLENVSNEGDYLFCLARQAKEIEEYRNFFLKTKKPIMIDNSIHENERLDDDDLVNLAIELRVKELVIPDIMGDGEETLKITKQFLDKYFKICNEHGIKLIGVIQGKTMGEIVKCFSFLNFDNRVDTMALPFDLTPREFVDERNLNQMFNRLYILQTLTSSYVIKKQIHALGVNSFLEVKLLDAFPQIRSCDSKIMYRLALSGIKLNEENWVHLVKPTRKMDFYDKLTSEQLEICLANINFLKQQLSKVK